ncbi:MAG: glycoside hydrolase family 95-like protein, partial [bacterium]
PTLSIGKSDVWDRRNPKPPQPVLTLKRIMEMAMEGDPAILNGTGYYTAYNSYDFPCPKPVGQLILKLNFMNPDGVVTFQRDSRSIQLKAVNGVKSVDMKIFVSAIRNLVVIDGHANSLEKGDISVRLYRHHDTILPGDDLHPTLNKKLSPMDFERLPLPRSGGNDEMFWVAQDFPADLTFPNGFTSFLAARIIGIDTEIETTTEQTGLGTPMITEKEGRLSHGVIKRFTPINEAPGSAATATFRQLNGPFQLIADVVTTQDDPDPQTKARRDLDEAAELGISTLWEEHCKQLTDYEKRPHARARSSGGTIEIDAVWGGDPYKPRPSGYYGDVPFCSVDSTKYCTQDSSMWHADFHFNEVEATDSCILRQYDYMDPYCRMIHTMLPMAQANAREVYDCRGAMYPLVHYPLKAETVIYANVTWEQSMEITALLAKPFWLRFLYTWDMDFLRDLAYPVLREGARFYADFLKKSEDGLYHVFPTVSPEHRGITKNLEFNRDSQSGITLIRYHLRAAGQAARLLGVDSEEAERWIEIAEHMPPYPTVDTSEGPIFIDVAGAQPMEYNIAVPLSAVFWGDDIGLDSPPDQLELAKRTLRLINVWEPHRFYLKRVKIRLGMVDPGDTLGVQNLLQSHTGVIRVFPAVPPDFEGGFSNFGAQGAFVVSAKRTKDGVLSIVVESIAGNPCVLANPWPDRQIQILDETERVPVAFQATQHKISFTTKKEHRYQLGPESNTR